MTEVFVEFRAYDFFGHRVDGFNMRPAAMTAFFNAGCLTKAQQQAMSGIVGTSCDVYAPGLGEVRGFVSRIVQHNHIRWRPNNGTMTPEMLGPESYEVDLVLYYP